MPAPVTDDPKNLRILILEDVPNDVELITRELRRGEMKFVSTAVVTKEDFVQQLEQSPPDLILADHALPAFDGFSALKLARRVRPDIPFIFVTGSMGEEFAIETFKKGATDYVLKTRLSNLLPAIVRAFRECDERIKRRDAEKALHQSERRFRALIENSMDGIALLDPRGLILYASPSTAQILGYASEDLIGKNGFSLMHPDDLERTAELFNRALKNPESTVRTEYRYRHQNGSWLWLEAVATNLIHEPIVKAFVTNFRDITERKRTEERLQTLARLQAAIAEFGKIAMVGIDPVLLMEDAVETVAGALRIEYAGVFELLSDGATLRLSAGVGWKQPLIGLATVEASPRSQSGYSTFTKETVAVEDLRSDPRFDWPPWMLDHGIVSGVSVPIKGRDQPMGALCVYCSNVRRFDPDEFHFMEAIAIRTGAALERRRAQEEIALLNAELEGRVIQRTAELKAAYQELESFSCSISHDLRAPLRHIGGFIELLQDEAGATLSETCRSYLKTISDATHQMGKLIDDLLELSRTSRAELNKTRVNLADLVHSAQRTFEKEIQSRDIQWVMNELPDIEGDPSLLRQVLVNLISNALKYTRSRRSTRIELGSSNSDDETVFFIRDNGVGFDMQYARKLFGVFQRLHGAAEFEGTGIGLANVRRIIERHGGRVWAEAKEGEGATFYFSLPKARQNRAAPAEKIG